MKLEKHINLVSLVKFCRYNKKIDNMQHHKITIWQWSSPLLGYILRSIFQCFPFILYAQNLNYVNMQCLNLTNNASIVSRTPKNSCTLILGYKGWKVSKLCLLLHFINICLANSPNSLKWQWMPPFPNMTSNKLTFFRHEPTLVYKIWVFTPWYGERIKLICKSWNCKIS